MMSCIQPGRIDDIECIGYLLLYLYRGDLPWSKLSFDDILNMKKSISTLADVPEYIKDFVVSTQGYTFDLKPDYGYFKALLSN